MKPKNKLYIIIFFLLFACEVEENPEPVSSFFLRPAPITVATLAEGEEVFSGKNRLIVRGQVNGILTQGSIKAGHVLGNSPQPTRDNNLHKIEGSVTGFPSEIRSQFDDLSPNTPYYIRAFGVDVDGSIVYGEQITVKTLQFNAVVANRFDGIDPDSRTLFFEEKFENNSGNWFSNTQTDVATGFNGGFYFMEAKNTQTWFTWGRNLDIAIDPSKNFEITVNIAIASGSRNGSYCGFFWGMAEDDIRNGFYYIRVNGQQRYDVGARLPNRTSSTRWKGERLTNAISGINTLNTLTIRKYKNTYYFFINGFYVYEQELNPITLYGNRFGLISENRSTVLSNLIRVEYFE